MALNESATFVASLLLSVLTFSAMQVLKPSLVSSRSATVCGGALGSLLFLFLLTAVSNLEKSLLGRHFASRWTEVALCLGLSAACAASVHRVCATTCVLFSLAVLHGIHRISQEVYEVEVAPPSGAAGAQADRAKKRK